MAALDFPASPSLNQVYSANGRSWIWDGTAWNPYGSGIADGDRGDITVSAGGSQWDIDPEAVTYAKMQNVSAASRLLGRGSASGAGDVEEISLGTGLSMTGTTLSATGGGTVTSVDVSGGTTGLTTSGGPITGSGTITLAGTLAATNGGTGLTSLGSGIPTFLGTPSSTNLAAALTDETGTGVAVFSDNPTFTTRINAPEIKATGAGGVDVHNNAGTQVALFGAGGSTGTTLVGTTNVGSASADYHQVAGGTGTITDTATGSSTNININLVPKGTGRLQAGGVTVPTISSTDSLTNKTLSTGTAVDAAISWGDGVRQTFNPDATNAGINVGSVAGDPSSPSNGDIWYDSTANELTARINGSNVALGAGGGSTLQYAQLGSNVNITDNATFQNITGLSFSAAANTSYRIRFHMAVSTSATSTGYEVGINGPASPTGYFAIVSLWNSATAETASITNSTTYGSIGSNANAGGGTARPCEGIILFHNGANAGTFNLQGKVETAVSGTVTFETGSFMTWEEVTT